MPDTLYYCTKENNTCVKKEDCKRYVNKENDVCTTLFKVACNEDSNFILYIKNQEEGENNG